MVIMMNINTDYAQYWAYGHKDEPIEPPKPVEEPKDDTIKSRVITPMIIKKHRSGRSKL